MIGLKYYSTESCPSVSWFFYFGVPTLSYTLHIFKSFFMRLALECSLPNRCQNVGKVCQILNKPFKNCQRLLKIHHFGEISPNLVTMLDCQFKNCYKVLQQPSFSKTLAPDFSIIAIRLVYGLGNTKSGRCPKILASFLRKNFFNFFL